MVKKIWRRRTCNSLQIFSIKFSVGIYSKMVWSDLPHSSLFNFDFSSRNFFGNSKSSRVYDLDSTSYLTDRRDLGKLESKWIWRIVGNDLVLSYVLWRWLRYDKLRPGQTFRTKIALSTYREIYKVRLQEYGQRLVNCHPFQNSWRGQILEREQANQWEETWHLLKRCPRRKWEETQHHPA